MNHSFLNWSVSFLEHQEYLHFLEQYSLNMSSRKLNTPLSLICRLDFQTILHQLKEGISAFSDTAPNSDDFTNAPAVPLDQTSLWRTLLYKNPPASSQEMKRVLNPTANSVEQGMESDQTHPRGRRSTHARGHHHQHGQFMRVGCVLGTCQVQKLSHRLYQLVGQTGREATAPINPHSPHSYGWCSEKLQPQSETQQNSSTCVWSQFLLIVSD